MSARPRARGADAPSARRRFSVARTLAVPGILALGAALATVVPAGFAAAAPWHVPAATAAQPPASGGPSGGSRVSPVPGAPPAPAPSSPPPALLPALASELGLPTRRMEAAVRAVALKQWTSYVRTHPVPAARARAVEQRITQAPVTLQARFGAPQRLGLMGAAAAYLGLDRAGLAAELRQGRSLADVAAAQGKSVEGLRAALHAAATAQLDRRVAEGEMTPAERQKVLAALSDRLQAMIEHRFGQPGPPPPSASAGSPSGPGGAGTHAMGLPA